MEGKSEDLAALIQTEKDNKVDVLNFKDFSGHSPLFVARFCKK